MKLLIKNAAIALMIVMGIKTLFEFPIKEVTIPGEGVGIDNGETLLFIILIISFLFFKFTSNIIEYYSKIRKDKKARGVEEARIAKKVEQNRKHLAYFMENTREI